jgi:ornithine--oxo-acid transaminase
MAGRLDVAQLLQEARGRARASYPRHVNPAFARLVETTGFDEEFIRGEGPYLWTADGRCVLDCLAGYGALVLGRGHPLVRDALRQCLELDPPAWVRFELNPLAAEAARRLKDRCRWPDARVFFTNSGTEGVEAAIKFARAHTGRGGILGWDDGFHGLTLGSLAINGNAELRRGFGPFPPGCGTVPFGDLAALERALAGREVAALVVEPVQGKTLRMLPPGGLAEVAKLCRRFGTLLVADEVQTGVGRTGEFLALHHDGVEADLVVLSKALSGGYVPVGAVLAREDVWRSTFSSMERSIVHSSTFHEGPLAMVALVATLEALSAEDLVARAATSGEALRTRLEESCRGLPAVREVRGRGFMLGIELDAARIPSLASLPGVGSWTAPMVGQAAAMDLFRWEGILAQVTGSRRPVLKLLPPLVAGPAEVDRLVEALPAVARRLASGSFFPALARAVGNLARSALFPTRPEPADA